eukprot:8099300-Alexandrium_andersonii.AAC.1
MTPKPGRGLGGWNLRLFSASERALLITYCARIMDRRRIRRWTGLPDYGVFSALGRCLSCLLYTSPSPRD